MNKESWEAMHDMVVLKNRAVGEGNIVCLSPETAASLALWAQRSRVIASAPEMLATLEKHEATLSNCAMRGERAKPSVSELNAMLKDFRAAIAKALAA